MRVALAAGLVACVALVPAAWLEAGARGAPEPTLRAGATVEGRVQVRDGDTLVVGGVPVRLAGLHCPEAREPGGAAATARLRSLVAGGAGLLRPHRRTDLRSAGRNLPCRRP